MDGFEEDFLRSKARGDLLYFVGRVLVVVWNGWGGILSCDREELECFDEMVRDFLNFR